MFKILRPIFHIINAVAILALIAIHFIIKESTYQTSLYYYTFPLPAIIIIVLVLSIFLSKSFRKYNLFIAGIFLIIWLSRSFKIHFPDAIDETDVEVVFWNATHYREFEDVFEEDGSIPDVVVLVEYHGDYLEEARTNYSKYHFYESSAEEMGIFSKEPIQVIQVMPSKYGSTVINFKTHDLNFYAVDVSASIDVPRSWELEFVDETITQTKNTVVLGDFNVPYESKFLDPIKENFNHAFTEKGNGFRETWFWNIPFLSLDHIWASKDLEILRAKKIGTWKSDHAIVSTIIRAKL
ncbi:endonuclease/exonuclease/phosphatase family protein [Seonamhaeicola sp.]|uniref:endonuclease/exonuclease/phosphatase family protein n=1 Tax=Seonamhaeicola sp. TaxID=1912245 RepID=UPI002630FE81|nr:endonuclease/exonuclease/phosphatase family protein [Seonamhaeicola sp.]